MDPKLKALIQAVMTGALLAAAGYLAEVDPLDKLERKAPPPPCECPGSDAGVPS